MNQQFSAVQERVATFKSDTIAVAHGDQRISFAELNRRSDRLAAHLVSLGVGPEVVVGLCLPRSIALVVSSLAVLKAGGAFLPIDVNAPRTRRKMMLTDCEVPVVITSNFVDVPSGPWKLIRMNEQGEFIGDAPIFETKPVSADQLAYVIYTSGSTGAPKGVEVTHANLVNLVEWHQRAFAITSADRATVIASPGFDASVWEMWPYLTLGASLAIPSDSIRTSPESLRDWFLNEKITMSFLPTSLAERMLELYWPGQTSLRYLLTGADTLRRRPSARLPFKFVNNYGPTECTVVATSGIVATGGSSLPSIGKAIDNLSIHILNADRQPAGVGPGEIHISGASVTRGYRKRPDLTAERFVTVNGERMYKTGDLAQWMPNGQIAFLGRVDDQIKVRGFRIEPNEIAVTLDQNPTVRSSAVIAKDAGGGDMRLVAYIVPNAESQLTERGLQESLRKTLPDYMIPSTFVKVDFLPMTENGKLDRAALPHPDADNTIRDEEFVAPSTPLEERVADLVCELLRLQQVGVHDNFFLLGGHSLMGTQLISRVNRAFDVELTLRAVFDAPTVASLAEVVEESILDKLSYMSEEEAEQLLV